jgi:hypothetical protein
MNELLLAMCKLANFDTRPSWNRKNAVNHMPIGMHIQVGTQEVASYHGSTPSNVKLTSKSTK